MIHPPQVALTAIGECEDSRILERQEARMLWKDRTLEALKKVSGPLTIAKLATLTKSTKFAVSVRVCEYPATFKPIRRLGKGKISPIEAVDLVPAIRTHVEYEKSLKAAS